MCCLNFNITFTLFNILYSQEIDTLLDPTFLALSISRKTSNAMSIIQCPWNYSFPRQFVGQKNIIFTKMIRRGYIVLFFSFNKFTFTCCRSISCEKESFFVITAICQFLCFYFLLLQYFLLAFLLSIPHC